MCADELLIKYSGIASVTRKARLSVRPSSKYRFSDISLFSSSSIMVNIGHGESMMEVWEWKGAG